jgi:hypothetical protein
VAHHVRAALTGSSVILVLALLVVLVVVVPARRAKGPKGALPVPGSTGTASGRSVRRAWSA